MASTNPIKKGAVARIVFPIYDADGDLVTGAAGLDSEYSLDGGSFSNCSDEAHEMATASGIYYLDLTTDETNGDVIAIQVKTSTSGAKTTVLVFYTAAQTLNEMDAVGDAILEDTGTTLPATLATINGYVDKIDDATDGLTAIKAEVEGLGGAAMRGTDSAALASVCTETRLAELDAANVPAITDAIKAKTDNLPASPAPASEYDTEMAHLNADITSRAPANEYDTEMAHLDADITSRAAAGEYTATLLLLTRLLSNKLEVDVTQGRLNLYNDAGTSVIMYWPLTDKLGGAISVGTGVPCTRGVSVTP